jgi:hypothetical protein
VLQATRSRGAAATHAANHIRIVAGLYVQVGMVSTTIVRIRNPTAKSLPVEPHHDADIKPYRALVRRTLSDGLARLRAENDSLRRRLELYERSAPFVLGAAAERFVLGLVGGSYQPRGSPFDLVAGSGARVEVKCSRLSKVSMRRPTTRYWAWSKILGEGGSKQYDFLVLVGEPDERYRSTYAEPAAEWLLFAVPCARVPDLLHRNGRYRSIYLTTNPATVKCIRARTLYSEYQISSADLRRRLRGGRRAAF